jgi:uncharacterized protein YbaR (Trm112 family)/SAM-dependent methyltransferase
MKYRLLDFLQCPHCKDQVYLHVFKENKVSYKDTDKLSNENMCPAGCNNPDPKIKKTPETENHCKACYESEIIEGLLTCKCGKVFPVVRSVPRFLPDAFDQHPEFTKKYFNTINKYDKAVSATEKEHFKKMFKETQGMFATQWKKWGRSERLFGFTDAEARDWFLTDLTGKDVDADYFKGKVVLEVGCGHGRFVQILNNLCNEYVAFDLGSGVDLAHEITQDRPNVHIIQANAMMPPLKEEGFDYVWSHGVLHHTPSTRDAFNAISKLPKKRSGRIYIWVYHKGGFLWEYGNRLIRSITTRLPSSVMHIIAYSLVPLLYLIPAYNKRVNLSNMSWAECALSTHDWLSPKYQWHHSVEEVMSWYKEQGFRDIEQTSANGVGITGVRK